MKVLPQLIYDDVKLFKLLVVPKLARPVTIAELESYNTSTINKSKKYPEKKSNPSKATCFSLDSSAYKSDKNVKIRFLSTHDHEINFD